MAEEEERGAGLSTPRRPAAGGNFPAGERASKVGAFVSPADSTVSWTRFEHVLAVACALFPASLAAVGATSSAPTSHDEGVVRAVGLGWTGLFRGLDGMLAAPLMVVPLGTRALRAGLASALVTAACGAIAFSIARELLISARPLVSRNVVSAVAATLVLGALLAPQWQTEGAAPAGAVTGALLVLLAAAVGQRSYASGSSDVRPIGLVLGLSASYEPLVFVAALAAVAPWVHGIAQSRPIRREHVLSALPTFAFGLVPMAFALAAWRRAPEIAIAAAKPLASPLGENAGTSAPLSLVMTEIGAVVLVAAAFGIVVTVLVPAARRALLSLLGIALVGALAVALRAPTGPWHVAAPVLAAIVALHLLASLALVALVVAVGTARVPFARASAALVLVLGFVLPFRAADDTSARRALRAQNSAAIWNEVAWGSAPPAAVVLVADPIVMRRVSAARAVGQMRPDLVVVPTFALPSRMTDRALREEPALSPFYRDVALGTTPEELSLAQLAGARPVLTSFDPRWERNLGRHFVAVGLTTRYEQEPRGVSERRHALEGFEASRDLLVRISVAKQDPDIAAATASLLRGRAIAAAASGERDLLSRALEDLRPFAPDDRVANLLVRRMVTTRGPIEIRDLAP